MPVVVWPREIVKMCCCLVMHVNVKLTMCLNQAALKKNEEKTQIVCVLPVRDANSPNTLSIWKESPHKVKSQHDSRKCDSALGILTKPQQFVQRVTLALGRRVPLVQICPS